MQPKDPQVRIPNLVPGKEAAWPGPGTPCPRTPRIWPTSLGPQQPIPLTSRRVRPSIVFVSSLPPQGPGDREEKQRSTTATGSTWAQPSLLVTAPFNTEYSHWSDCRPEEMIFARDWLAPQGTSRGGGGERVERRLRAGVAVGIWKRLFLCGVGFASAVRRSRRVLPRRGRVLRVLILVCF